MATARVLAENRREPKSAIDARRGREEAVNVVDVDIDTVRLKAAVQEAGDTGSVRGRASIKQMRQVLKTAQHVRDRWDGEVPHHVGAQRARQGYVGYGGSRTRHRR